MEKLKTLKIKENTHLVLKWLQTQEKLRKQEHTDIDAIIYKAIATYAFMQHYPIDEAVKILENYEQQQKPSRD